MKIVILTEGGQKMGFGHITRCSAIYDAFCEKGVEPLFLINGDSSVTNILRDKQYKIFDWTKDIDLMLKEISNCNLTVVDSYLCNLNLCREIAFYSRSASYIDDNNRLNYPKGTVINGAVYAKELNYEKNTGKRYLLGPEYMPLREEFWSVTPRRIKKYPESIMITFGGDDLRNLTIKISKHLQTEFPFLKQNIVVGNCFQNKEQIKSVLEETNKIFFSPDAGIMKNIMMKSDIAISSGGQTLYELARTGTPTIAVSVVDNQINNVNYWSKTRIIDYAGNFDDPDLLSKLDSLVASLKNQHIRTVKSEKSQAVINGLGAVNIVTSLLNN